MLKITKHTLKILRCEHRKCMFGHFSTLCMKEMRADSSSVIHLFLNPFAPSAPFLYPMKISENHKVF